MPRLAFKPDSSFFRKIVMGAVGSRAVRDDLNQRGHDMAELERGSTETKLWKDVKRKRVRIPDLVCVNCGLRVESRAKTKTELSMSHSPTEDARAWDYGMVDDDLVAFPVCSVAKEEYRSSGNLAANNSYWNERSWVNWRTSPWINYFRVHEFRRVAPSKSSRKGVTEGSEMAIAWPATFSTRDGTVEQATNDKITIARTADGHRHTWRIQAGTKPLVSAEERVHIHQAIASSVTPSPQSNLKCPNNLSTKHIRALLASREKTQRFTGIRIARLRADSRHRNQIAELERDPEEDIYIRLEAASYLAALGGSEAESLFQPYLCSQDEQIQLEAAIALGECASRCAISLLCGLIDDETQPYFLRSAAAWSLGHIPSREAADHLIKAFADVSHELRREALDGIVSLGELALPLLEKGLGNADDDIAAGCAEALRKQPHIVDDVVNEICGDLSEQSTSRWAVWLLGNLPRDHVAARVSRLQNTAPELHYAISLLWSFTENWIAERWDLHNTSAIQNSGGDSR